MGLTEDSAGNLHWADGYLATWYNGNRNNIVPSEITGETKQYVQRLVSRMWEAAYCNDTSQMNYFYCENRIG